MHTKDTMEMDRPNWRRFVPRTRRGIAALIIVALVALAGGAAWAIFQARADIDGTVDIGNVALDFTGSVVASYIPDTSTMITGPVPAGVTATASIDGNGDLQIVVANILPGEAVIVKSFKLLNGSTLDLTNVALDLNAQPFTAEGTPYAAGTSELNVFFAANDPVTFAWGTADPAVEYGTIAPGAETLAAYGLAIVVPPDANPNGSSYTLTGLGFTADAVR